MSVVLPRLDRESAVAIIDRYRTAGLEAVAKAMPEIPEIVTYAPVGGARVENTPAGFVAVREALLLLAQEHGMPGDIQRMPEFEGRAARLLHDMVPMTPHEAAHDEVWTYLTCCWLLDIAIWRFSADADVRRFLGDINRNTFRRMWWRAEIFGPGVDLTTLREDELVQIMERPTLASDRRLARAMAAEFLGRVERDEAQERMRLMREASKRLLRLTPFVAFSALSESELLAVVGAAFEAASAGIVGVAPAIAVEVRSVAPAPSPEVADITALSTISVRDDIAAADEHGELDAEDAVAQVALDLARKTGRVTNLTLRNVTHITSEEALDVLKGLVSEGRLVRKGERRGTHYVMPIEVTPAAEVTPVAEPADLAPLQTQETTAASPRPRESVPPPTPPFTSPRPIPGGAPRSPADSALRRLLRRGR